MSPVEMIDCSTLPPEAVAASLRFDVYVSRESRLKIARRMQAERVFIERERAS